MSPLGIDRRKICAGFSDAGRLRDGAAYSAAGVRKPPKDETALGDRGRMHELSRVGGENNFQTIRKIVMGI